jgi:hypothetical protein
MDTNPIADTINMIIDEILDHPLNILQNNGNAISDFVNTFKNIHTLTNHNPSTDLSNNDNFIITPDNLFQHPTNTPDLFNLHFSNLYNPYLLSQNNHTFHNHTPIYNAYTNPFISPTHLINPPTPNFNFGHTFPQSIDSVIQTSFNTDPSTYKNIISDKGSRLLKIETYSQIYDQSPIICPIMMTPFNIGDLLIRLPCDHLFSHDSILNWLHNESSKCPVCRFDLPSISVKKNNHNKHYDLNISNSDSDSNSDSNSDSDSISHYDSLSDSDSYTPGGQSTILDELYHNIITDRIFDHFPPNNNDIQDLLSAVATLDLSSNPL